MRKGETAVHSETLRGATEINQLLADRGARHHVKGKQGRTPLKIAEGDNAQKEP
jgi:hypothetical protein